MASSLQSYLDGLRSERWKSTNTADESCVEDRTKVSSPDSRSSATLKRSTENRGEDSSMSSVADFPASRIRRQARRKARTTNVISGPKPSVSYAKWDPLSRSWKTCQGFFPTTISAKSSVTWRKAGTMRNGTLYQRRPSERRTYESDCGYLPTEMMPTLQARDWKGSQGPNSTFDSLPRRSAGKSPKKFAPTLRATDAKGTRSTTAHRKDEKKGILAQTMTDWLVEQGDLVLVSKPNGGNRVVMPTLRAQDANGPQGKNAAKKRMEEGGDVMLSSLLIHGTPLPTESARDWKDTGTAPSESNRHTPPLATVVGGKLNPTWCEWYMGFPLQWTALEVLEMPKFLSWLQKHFDYLQDEPV